MRVLSSIALAAAFCVAASSAHAQGFVELFDVKVPDGAWSNVQAREKNLQFKGSLWIGLNGENVQPGDLQILDRKVTTRDIRFSVKVKSSGNVYNCQSDAKTIVGACSPASAKEARVQTAELTKRPSAKLSAADCLVLKLEARKQGIDVSEYCPN